ncbi:MAG: hypothetical protein ABI477_09660 [Chryseolinea sp.]
MNSKKQSDDKKPGAIKPDDGQGSEGKFGSDGDWGKPKEKEKAKQPSSPVPVKRTDD